MSLNEVSSSRSDLEACREGLNLELQEELNVNRIITLAKLANMYAQIAQQCWEYCGSESDRDLKHGFYEIKYAILLRAYRLKQTGVCGIFYSVFYDPDEIIDKHRMKIKFELYAGETRYATRVSLSGLLEYCLKTQKKTI